MTATLIESLAEMQDEASVAARYVAALSRDGVPAFVANASSRMMLIRTEDGRTMPVTVDDGGYGRSYVASAHSAYALYARDELNLVGMRRGRQLATAAIGLVDLALRAANINRTVHVDNWLLSTNLHGDWDGAALPSIRRFLTARFPDHFLMIRSLDEWSCPALLAAARSDGWSLLPARQVWVVDDLARDWRPRNNHANDRRALARSNLVVEDAGMLDLADRRRIAELYHMLYVGRYSALNPIFTERFIALTQDIGMASYRLARAHDGTVMAVAGMIANNGVMTPPVVGYDTSRPPEEALYRIACFMFCDWAMQRGLRLHGSAGAGHFKRTRGAHGVIEYMAIHAGHLPGKQRAVVRMLKQLLDRLAVPVMRRRGW
jgi:hypothetical protein